MKWNQCDRLVMEERSRAIAACCRGMRAFDGGATTQDSASNRGLLAVTPRQALQQPGSPRGFMSGSRPARGCDFVHLPWGSGYSDAALADAGKQPRLPSANWPNQR